MIIHQFTFGPDGACSVESIARARTLYPESLIIVWYDKAKPLDGSTMLRLKGLAEVRGTYFPRNGNLNGRDCFEGMVTCYKYGLERRPGEYSMKLDADTLIVRRQSQDKAVRDKVYAAAWCWDTWAFSGTGCLLSPDLVEDMHAAVVNKTTIPGVPLSGNEDLCTGAYACHLSDGREVREWRYSPAGGYAASYQYSKAKVPVSEYLRRFEVVTFGERALLPKDLTEDQKRTRAAGEMAAAQKLLACRTNPDPLV